MHTHFSVFGGQLPRKSVPGAGLACLLAPALAFCQPAPAASVSPAASPKYEK